MLYSLAMSCSVARAKRVLINISPVLAICLLLGTVLALASQARHSAGSGSAPQLPDCLAEMLRMISPRLEDDLPVERFSGKYPADWPHTLRLPDDALLVNGSTIKERQMEPLPGDLAPRQKMSVAGITHLKLDSFIEQCARSLQEDWVVTGTFFEYRRESVSSKYYYITHHMRPQEFGTPHESNYISGKTRLPRNRPIEVRLWCTKSNSDGTFELVTIRCYRCDNSHCQWRYFQITRILRQPGKQSTL